MGPSGHIKLVKKSFTPVFKVHEMFFVTDASCGLKKWLWVELRGTVQPKTQTEARKRRKTETGADATRDRNKGLGNRNTG